MTSTCPSTSPKISSQVGAEDLINLANKVVTHRARFYKIISRTVIEALHDLKTTSSNLFHRLQEQVIVTAIPPLTTSTYKVCHEIERIFNIAGCIPGLGILAGSIRTILGRVQAITGLAIVAISEVGRFLASQTSSNKELVKKWEDLSQFGLTHLVHGTLNVLRGTGEMLVGSYTMGLGNAPLLIPNLINRRNFTPYYDYPIASKVVS